MNLEPVLWRTHYRALLKSVVRMIMETTAILMLPAMAGHATAQSDTMPGVASPTPRWTVVESPRQWPQEADGSNSLIQCVAFVEAEIAKAKSFLLTGSYHIIEGGPKSDPPHVVVPYPDATTDTWTIFFAKDTLQPYSIVRKGSAVNRYRIHLDLRSGLLTDLSSTKFSVACEPPGILRRFSVPVRDNMTYTVGWDGKGHRDTEAVYDWTKRGKPVDQGTNQPSEDTR